MDIKTILPKLISLGLTQSQIGIAIGCKQSTISDYLSGKIGQARPSHKIVSGLEALAKKYGIETNPPKTNRAYPREQLVRETSPTRKSVKVPT